MKSIFHTFASCSIMILVLCLAVFSISAAGGQIYRWVDEEGTVHMTEDPSSIPPQYRNQTQRKNLESIAEPLSKTEPRTSGIGNSADRPRTGLKRFEVPYKGFEGTARRIIIPVILNESIAANLLIDTGAPGLVISPKLADRLGLLKDTTEGLQITAAGIGGSVPAMLSMVDSVRIGDAQAEFLPATVTPIPSDEFEGLVGMDFMANYRIGIDIHRSVITFDEQPTQQDRPGGHDELWWRSNFRNILHFKAEWSRYLASLDSANLSWNETETRKKLARNQYNEAEKLYRKLERFASENAVPNNWRQ